MKDLISCGVTYKSDSTCITSSKRHANQIGRHGIKFGLLTSLRGRGEETDLDLFLAEFIGKLDDSIPGTLSDRLAENIKIINEMNLASLINGDLVAGTDAQTGVVVRTIVHETFAGGRVGLFIERAGNGQLCSDTCLEVVLI